METFMKDECFGKIWHSGRNYNSENILSRDDLIIIMHSTISGVVMNLSK